MLMMIHFIAQLEEKTELLFNLHFKCEAMDINQFKMKIKCDLIWCFLKSQD